MASFVAREHIIDAAHVREYARAIRTSQNDVLKLVVKEYTPRSNPDPQPGDVTIIGAHANGFPKELYEPLWEDLLARASTHGFRIRSILIADTAWQGQSGLLNESKLGNEPGWYDYSRDMLHMINTLRPPQPLVGVGHSFGGNAITNLAIMHPRLFATLVLLDPVISHWSANAGGTVVRSPAAASIYRRDTWPSREEAAAAFARNPFYKTWDPRALQAWVDHGVRETNPGSGGKEVTLTTSKHQEVFTYFRPTWDAYDAEGKKLVRPELVPDLDTGLDKKFFTFPVYRPEGAMTTDRLPLVRPGVLYIFGGDSDLSTPELRDEKMRTTGTGVGGSGGRDKGRVKEVTLAKKGHLVPMEVPAVCAEEAAQWIAKELGIWRSQQAEYEAWQAKSEEEKSTLTDEWRRRIGRAERPKSKPNGEGDKAKI